MRISDWSSYVCSSDLLGAVADDAAVLLRDPGQEARHVDQGHQRDVEGVAEPDEPRALVGGVDVEHPGDHAGLVGDDAERTPGDPAEDNHDEIVKTQRRERMCKKVYVLVGGVTV